MKTHKSFNGALYHFSRLIPFFPSRFRKQLPEMPSNAAHGTEAHGRTATVILHDIPSEKLPEIGFH